jgi:hypothetical protein
VLREIRDLPELKMAIAYEIQIFCRTVGISLEAVKVSGLLSKRRRPNLNKSADFTQKAALSVQLNVIISKLTKGIAGFTEKDLDTIILPHPLLGKITYREMMYFTICHVLHHQALIKKALQERSH